MIYCLARTLWLVTLWLDLFLFSLLMSALALLPGRWTMGFYPALFQAWCRTFARALRVELRLHQHNRRPLPGRYILIANHPSAFEDIGIPALFPVYSVAKQEVADWWLVGRISRAAGTLYLDRESRESRRALAEQMVRTLEAGHNIAIYPEGGCKGRRIYESFRQGAFEASLRTGLPILPVFLHYEAQEDFEWDRQHLLHKIWQILTSRNSRANFHLFDAIEPVGFTSKEDYARHVRGLYLAWQAKYLD